MDFEKICMIFTMQEPYYGILLSSMDRRPDKNIETAGIWQSGNVLKLSYNPDFIESLPVEHVITLLKHEVLHAAFNHFTLWENKNVSKGEHNLRNIAEDLEINCYLNKDHVLAMKGCHVDSLGFEPRLGAREYYKLLVKKAQEDEQKNSAKQPQKPCNCGQGGQSSQPQQPQNQSQQNQQQNQQQNNAQQQGNAPAQAQNSGQGNPQPAQGNTGWGKAEQALADKLGSFDDHSRWPDTSDTAATEVLKQQIEDLLVFAAEEVEKGHGTIPGEMKGKITEIRNRKKPKPVADWKRYFRRYIGNEFSDMTKKSKKRESKRFPDAAGTRHRRKSHILVGIDTSGSVSMPEYREFCGQIKTLMATSTFHIVECDARIQHEYEFDGKIHENLHGGGGTAFEPVIDMFLENRRKYEGLVYFTDGGARIPKNTPKECLWVISSRGDHRRERYRVNNASVVFITEKHA